MVERRGVGLT